MFISKEMQAARPLRTCIQRRKAPELGRSQRRHAVRDHCCRGGPCTAHAPRCDSGSTPGASIAHQAPLSSQRLAHDYHTQHSSIFAPLRFYSVTCVIDEHMLSAPHQPMRCSCSTSGYTYCRQAKAGHGSNKEMLAGESPRLLQDRRATVRSHRSCAGHSAGRPAPPIAPPPERPGSQQTRRPLPPCRSPSSQTPNEGSQPCMIASLPRQYSRQGVGGLAKGSGHALCKACNIDMERAPGMAE